jgi:hypothetical protein
MPSYPGAEGEEAILPTSRSTTTATPSTVNTVVGLLHPPYSVLSTPSFIFLYGQAYSLILPTGALLLNPCYKET